MHAGGQTHLILAGDPEITGRVRQALPDDLADKLVDVIPASEHDQQTDVVMATLSSFIEHEAQESQSVAERLIEGLCSQNLAVAGSVATLDALRSGEVTHWSWPVITTPIPAGAARPVKPSAPKRLKLSFVRGVKNPPCDRWMSGGRCCAWLGNRSALWKWSNSQTYSCRCAASDACCGIDPIHRIRNEFIFSIRAWGVE